jgi:hypothetical protein
MVQWCLCEAPALQADTRDGLAGAMASSYAASSAAKAAGAEAQGQMPEKASVEVTGTKCCRARNPAWFTFLTLFRVSMSSMVSCKMSRPAACRFT